jgi:hypothetical protein
MFFAEIFTLKQFGNKDYFGSDCSSLAHQMLSFRHVVCSTVGHGHLDGS